MILLVIFFNFKIYKFRVKNYIVFFNEILNLESCKGMFIC